MTPMQKQYNELKKKYPDALLFFRLGDFFELFDDDAIEASKILGITLTGRGKGESRRPMAGIPHHAMNNYLPKLIEAGKKVAIADQTEEAVTGKLVKREVTKIITAGTITDEDSLDSTKNNYIGCVFITEHGDDSQTFNLAYADLTTGEFQLFNTKNALVFKNELNKINLSELLCSVSQFERVKIIFRDGVLQKLDDSLFRFDHSEKALIDQLEVKNLKGFGIDEEKELVIAAGVLLDYLRDTQKNKLNHVKTIHKYNYSDYMQLDSETIKNLELLYSNVGDERSTLYFVLDRCKNSMGKRMLRQVIVNPFVNGEMLSERLGSVDYFYSEPILMGEVRELLQSIFDIERLAGKLGYGSANPKDVKALQKSLEASIGLVKTINQSGKTIPTRLSNLIQSFDTKKIQEIIEQIKTQIDEEPSAVVNDGGYIIDGFNPEVDEYRNIKKKSREMLADIQKRESERTKIPSLKIGFNKVFGYYLEVTRTHSEKVPDSYIRKQTLANAERFITEELKELEEKILSSEDKLIELEKQLFFELLDSLCLELQVVLDLASVVAEIDLLSNFAFVARENDYCMPKIADSKSKDLDIENGRHPVVEKLTDEKFVANDVSFSSDSLIHILTGPNMSGKSTYIRQVALITLMAQIGSFVPAKSMKFALADRIFTRVGASDNLARGESTFMVEMNETANILNNATQKSLVILDEVGRGTSTYDGVAIAWSIIEYIANELKAKTLFATHYHELIELEESFDGVKNFNVLVSEEKREMGDEKRETGDGHGEIKFEYKIAEGGTDQSYGVHVAKIAGIPEEVTERAEEILEKFEGAGNDNSSVGTRHALSLQDQAGRRGPLRQACLPVGKAQDDTAPSDQNKPKTKPPKKSKKTTPKRPKKINPGQLELI